LSDELTLPDESKQPPYRAPDSVVREALSEDELVVLDSETHRFYSLNATAKRVYELAVEGLDVAAIGQRLSQEFDIEVGDCSEDVRALLSELCEQGILTKTSPAA
jgi:hypothetical protein